MLRDAPDLLAAAVVPNPVLAEELSLLIINRQVMEHTPALIIERLRKRFGRTEALRAVDLSVPRGTVFGFVGLNGAGKTTTLDCALGLLHPDGGDIRILDLPPAKIHRSGGRIGAVFDTSRLPPGLTVRQTLEHGRIACGRQSGPPEEVMALLGLEQLQGRKTRQLSQGNRRRLSIAVALLGRPDLLILDEPFSGLDAGGVEDVLALLGRLNREEGTTILLSSHRLRLVETISTRVCIIHEGATVAQGALDELLRGEGARLFIQADNREHALAVLRSMEGVQLARTPAAGEIEVELTGARPAEINERLVRAGVAVSELRRGRPSLLAYFQKLTGREV